MPGKFFILKKTPHAAGATLKVSRPDFADNALIDGLI